MMPPEQSTDLFSIDASNGFEPLAVRMRPRSLEEFLGQDHIVGGDTVLRKAITRDLLSSLIFSGPPGSGKTSLAHIIAASTKSRFQHLSAVLSGVKDLRGIISEAEQHFQYHRRRSILFVDEVHRWNAPQQDALLPWVERGIIIFIGATTENPFFEISNALISRSRVFLLKRISDAHLEKLLHRTLHDEARGYGAISIRIDSDAKRHLIQASRGDARILLNTLQLAVETGAPVFPPPRGTDIHLNLASIEQSLQEKAVHSDRQGDAHYDTISAFIKSVRGSDVDAALYWLARLLTAGHAFRYIFRRLLILAAEDIGMADPMGIVVVQANASAAEQVGMPEARYFLSLATIYLSTAAKSHSTGGIFSALSAVEEGAEEAVPTHLKDSARDGKAFGHGKGYLYPHDYLGHWVAQEYLPKGLRGYQFYHPSDQGFEAHIHKAFERRGTSPKNSSQQ